MLAGPAILGSTSTPKACAIRSRVAQVGVDAVDVDLGSVDVASADHEFCPCRDSRSSLR
jgi:hypothetical protein